MDALIDDLYTLILLVIGIFFLGAGALAALGRAPRSFFKLWAPDSTPAKVSGTAILCLGIGLVLFSVGALVTKVLGFLVVLAGVMILVVVKVRFVPKSPRS